MNNYLITGALIAVAFFAGKQSAPEKVKIEKEIVEKIVYQKVEMENQDKRKLVIETVFPSGVKTTKTLIRSKKQIQKVSSVESDVSARAQTVVESRRGVTVSILAGVPLTNMLHGSSVYGASASKQFIGPFSLGAWAFTDLRVGLSLGVEL